MSSSTHAEHTIQANCRALQAATDNSITVPSNELTDSKQQATSEEQNMLPANIQLYVHSRLTETNTVQSSLVHSVQHVPRLSAAPSIAAIADPHITGLGSSAVSVSAVTLSALNSNAATPSKPLCEVCKDDASGNHYGVNTCEGCKGFFRRKYVVTDGDWNAVTKCTNNRRCQINVSNRNTCQECRLFRCLQAGMARGNSKLGRKSKARSEQERASAVKAESGIGGLKTENKNGRPSVLKEYLSDGNRLNFRLQQQQQQQPIIRPSAHSTEGVVAAAVGQTSSPITISLTNQNAYLQPVSSLPSTEGFLGLATISSNEQHVQTAMNEDGNEAQQGANSNLSRHQTSSVSHTNRPGPVPILPSTTTSSTTISASYNQPAVIRLIKPNQPLVPPPPPILSDEQQQQQEVHDFLQQRRQQESQLSPSSADGVGSSVTATVAATVLPSNSSILLQSQSLQPGVSSTIPLVLDQQQQQQPKVLQLDAATAASLIETLQNNNRAVVSLSPNSLPPQPQVAAASAADVLQDWLSAAAAAGSAETVPVALICSQQQSAMDLAASEEAASTPNLLEEQEAEEVVLSAGLNNDVNWYSQPESTTATINNSSTWNEVRSPPDRIPSISSTGALSHQSYGSPFSPGVTGGSARSRSPSPVRDASLPDVFDAIRAAEAKERLAQAQQQNYLQHQPYEQSTARAPSSAAAATAAPASFSSILTSPILQPGDYNPPLSNFDWAATSSRHSEATANTAPSITVPSLMALTQFEQTGMVPSSLASSTPDLGGTGQGTPSAGGAGQGTASTATAAPAGGVLEFLSSIGSNNEADLTTEQMDLLKPLIAPLEASAATAGLSFDQDGILDEQPLTHLQWQLVPDELQLELNTPTQSVSAATASDAASPSTILAPGAGNTVNIQPSAYSTTTFSTGTINVFSDDRASLRTSDSSSGTSLSPLCHHHPQQLTPNAPHTPSPLESEVFEYYRPTEPSSFCSIPAAAAGEPSSTSSGHHFGHPPPVGAADRGGSSGSPSTESSISINSDESGYLSRCDGGSRSNIYQSSNGGGVAAEGGTTTTCSTIDEKQIHGGGEGYAVREDPSIDNRSTFYGNGSPSDQSQQSQGVSTASEAILLVEATGSPSGRDTGTPSTIHSGSGSAASSVTPIDSLRPIEIEAEELNARPVEAAAEPSRFYIAAADYRAIADTGNSTVGRTMAREKGRAEGEDGGEVDDDMFRSSITETVAFVTKQLKNTQIDDKGLLNDMRKGAVDAHVKTCNYRSERMIAAEKRYSQQKMPPGGFPPIPPGFPPMPPGGPYMPSSGLTMSFGGLSMPHGGPSMPPGGLTMPGGGPSMPPGGLTMPGGGPSMPPGGMTMPGGDPSMPPGGMTMPCGGLSMPPGGLTMSGGGPSMPPGGLTMPGGGLSMPPGGLPMPSGGTSMSMMLGGGGADMIWKIFLNEMERILERVIKFCQLLPGFPILPIEDRIMMLRMNLFKIVLLRVAPLIDVKTDAMWTFKLDSKIPRMLLNKIPNFGEFLEAQFQLAATINELQLTDEEVAIFTAILAFSSFGDRTSRARRKKILKVYEVYLKTFIDYVLQHRPDDKTFALRVLRLIPRIETLNAQHAEVLRKARDRRATDDFPDLHVEVFEKKIEGLEGEAEDEEAPPAGRPRREFD